MEAFGGSPPSNAKLLSICFNLFLLCSGFANFATTLGPYQRGCHTLPGRNSYVKSNQLKIVISVGKFVPFYRHTPWRRSVEKSSNLSTNSSTLCEELWLLAIMMLLAISVTLKSFVGRHYDFLKNFATCC